MKKSGILLVATLMAGLTGCSEAWYKTGMLGAQSGQMAVCAGTNVGEVPSDIHFEIRNLNDQLVKQESFYNVAPWKTVATMQTLTSFDVNARRVVCKAHIEQVALECLECGLSSAEARVNLIIQDVLGNTFASSDGEPVMSMVDEETIRELME